MPNKCKIGKHSRIATFGVCSKTVTGGESFRTATFNKS